jgi:large subunit ribosomal protein L29
MKIAELRAKSKEELKELVLNSKKEMFNLRMQSATGALENRGRFKEVRKDIARALTLINEQPGSVKPKAEKAPKAPKALKAEKPAKEEKAAKPAKAPKAEKAPAKKKTKAKKEE